MHKSPAVPKVKRVLIVLDSVHGHRGKWANILAIKASRLGLRVNLLTIQDERLSTLLNDITWGSNFDKVYTFKNVKQMHNFILSWRFPDQFIFLEVDRHLPWLSIHLVNFKGLVMRPYLESKSIKGFLSWIGKTLLIQLIQLRSPHRIKKLSIYFQRLNKSTKSWVSDDLTLQATKELLSTDLRSQESSISFVKSAIVVPGFLDLRKSPATSISAFLGLPEDIVVKHPLVFVGQASHQFIAFFEEFNHPNIHFFNSFLTDAEYITALKNAAVILLPYSNNGASGIVIEALQCGTPVVMLGNRNWKQLEKVTHGLMQVTKKSNLSNAIINAVKISKCSNATFEMEEGLTNISSFIFDEYNASY